MFAMIPFFALLKSADYALLGYTLQDYGLYFEAWGLDEDIAEQAFSQLDLSGDGRVSRSSFIQFSANFFTSDDPILPGSQLFGPYE
jgi:hypothetical protein